MKTIKYLFMLAVAASSLAISVTAQEESTDDPPQQEMGRRRAAPPRDIRNNVLRQLGLSNEQMQQIRSINIERRPQMEAAQTRLRLANRALDTAIYADIVNETDVQARILEVQAAQADVAKIRFSNELAVRRVLTPQQLIRFRDLRQQFEEERQEFRERRGLGERPFRRRQNNRGRDVPGSQQPGMRPNQQPPN